jgi:hypothetical protein
MANQQGQNASILAGLDYRYSPEKPPVLTRSPNNLADWHDKLVDFAHVTGAAHLLRQSPAADASAEVKRTDSVLKSIIGQTLQGSDRIIARNAQSSCEALQKVMKDRLGDLAQYVTRIMEKLCNLHITQSETLSDFLDKAYCLRDQLRLAQQEEACTDAMFSTFLRTMTSLPLLCKQQLNKHRHSRMRLLILLQPQILLLWQRIRRFRH